MRIGINASFLRKPGTGIGQVTRGFLTALARDEGAVGHEFVLFLEEDADISFLPANFSKRVFLPFWRRDDVPRRWLWEKRLAAEARQAGCAAFISLSQSATIFSRSFQHLMVVHDIIPEIFPEYRGGFSKRLAWNGVKRGITHASKILAVSHATRDDVHCLLNVPEERIVVAWPGIDPRFFSVVPEEEKRRVLAKYGLEEGYIYHGGGLEVRKNTAALLRAYEALAGTLPNLPPLVISGKLFSKSNPLATDLEGIVTALGLEGAVKVLGFVPEGDLPALYAASRCFVFPSLYEGFGLPVAEALASGTPVITSDTSSLPEITGNAALLVDPLDEGAIRDALRLLLTDDAAHARLVAASRGQALQFTWTSFVSAALSFLE